VRSGAAHQFFHCLQWRSCRLIDPVRGHCLESIGDGDNTRAQRDGFLPQTKGVARAIPLLVVGAHQRCQMAQHTAMSKNQCSSCGMLLNVLILKRREAGRFVKDKIVYANFADIVEERGQLNRLQFTFRQIKRSRKLIRILLHAPRVPVEFGIFCLHRLRERRKDVSIVFFSFAFQAFAQFIQGAQQRAFQLTTGCLCKTAIPAIHRCSLRKISHVRDHTLLPLKLRVLKE